MAELKKILSYPANDIDKILQQGIYSVADDNERLALPTAIKTTNRTVYVRSTDIFYVWDGTEWGQLSTPIDDEMSDTSENAVQNKVIKEYVDDAVDSRQGKDLVFTNITVDNWVVDNTYVDYPYRASVSLTGADMTMIPFVAYDIAEANSGNYSPVAESYVGGIYIWGKSNAAITIPAIVLSKSLDLNLRFEANQAGGYTLIIEDSQYTETPNVAGGLTLTVEG